MRILIVHCALFCMGFLSDIYGRNPETYTSTLAQNLKLDYAVDYHITDSLCPIADGASVNLVSEDAWLYLDAVKPNDVIRTFGSKIKIKGKGLVPDVNARVSVYCQGTLIIPHKEDFSPLSVYTQKDFKGNEERLQSNFFYSNQMSEYAPENLVQPLKNDNTIRSFRLRRGYMATLANNPDGMGYSRVFVADTADLNLTELPDLLDEKVSFIRVMPWQYVSKKGWAGSVWNAMPEGLKYVEEQCDYTNSTWFYNWSATTEWTTNPKRTEKSYNQEFVPEKWGKGGDFSELYTLQDVTHLMGYNEPDHKEQSDVTVEKAIEEWPVLQGTGLRLGSPATTDFNWLYSFMSEAKKHNYRVDYVVIHAYWGGLSGAEWYKRLKEVHDRTKRPIWIKEWNNGANWTHEGWPAGTEAQQAKQLQDLKDILTVMDTASFVERYSIYNWVEDKRAVILPNAKLTPAGKYYKDNKSNYFFSHDNEFIPVWTVRTAPVFAYCGKTDDNEFRFSWKDDNWEFIKRYVIERAFTANFCDAETVAVIESDTYIVDGNEMTCSLPLDEELNTFCYYRLKSVSITGVERTSNSINVTSVVNSTNDVCWSEACITENWSPVIFKEKYEKPPIVLPGIATYRNKMPLSCRVKDVDDHSFDFSLMTWNYQLNPSFINPDTLAVVVLPSASNGRYEADWNGVYVQAATEECVGCEWKRVSYARPFATIPVVIPCQITNKCVSASSVRIRNVDEKGFDVCIRYEGGLSVNANAVTEAVSYLAVTTGMGMIGGRKVIVGNTPNAVVGDNMSGGYAIHYPEGYFDRMPLLFGAMQTEEDTITSTLRIKNRDLFSAVIFKDREKAVAHERVKPEKVGWIAVAREASEQSSGIFTNLMNEDRLLLYNKKDYRVSSFDGRKMSRILVFDLQGRIVASVHNAASISLAHLPNGIYMIKADGIGQLKISVDKKALLFGA